MTVAEQLLAKGEAKGRQEGRQEGREEGRQEGKWIGKVQAFQEVLGKRQSPLEELEALSQNEMQALHSSLRRECEALLKRP